LSFSYLLFSRVAALGCHLPHFHSLAPGTSSPTCRYLTSRSDF
jgi:hypothetical protein